MVGIPELFIKWSAIGVAVAILLAGINRLRKKLGTESSPGLMTYINELGGYVIAFIVFLVLGVVVLMEDAPSPDETHEQAPPAPVETSSQPPATTDTTWQVHLLSGGTVAISTPDHWVPAPLPDPSPDELVVVDWEKSVFLLVGLAPKGAPGVTTVKDAASVCVAGITTTTQNTKVKSEQSVQLGEFAAVKVELLTTLENLPAKYVTYAVDLNDRWAEIRFWSAPEQIDSQRPTLTQIAESIRFVPEDPTAKSKLLFPADRYPGETTARQFQMHMAASGLLRQGKLDDAIEEHTSCIEIDPNFGSAYFGRGQAYKAKGEYAKAVADFSRVLAVERASSRVYNERGLAYAHLGVLDRALADFTEALRLDGTESASAADHAATLCNRSDVYVRLDQPLIAMADLDAAVEVAPKFAESYYLRGSLRHRRGNGAGAVSDLSTAIELSPNDYRPRYSRATILSTSHDDSLRDGAQAILDATSACELTEFRDASVMATLAAAHAEAGDWKTAEQYAAKAIEAATDEKLQRVRDFVAPISSGKPVRWP